MSVLFWINRARISKTTNLAPIYARITINGKRVEISTGKSTQLEKWIVNVGRVKGHSEEARTINKCLDNTNIRLDNIYQDLLKSKEFVSASDVKNSFLGKDKIQHSLLGLFDSHNEQLKQQIGKGYSEGTYKRYLITVRHLKAFMKKYFSKQDFVVEELDYAFISNFEYFLKTDKGIGHNATMKYLKNLKKVVALARKYRWIDHDPFAGFKITQIEVNKEFLTKEEISKIIEKELGLTRLAQVRDVFIFCCYTGLSFADVKKLTMEAIQIGLDGELWIMINREKTGVQSYIPLLPEAKLIVEKYNNEIIINTTGKLFPISSNQKTNAYLKEIGDLCGIKKNITFHMARHTFATTITLSNGVSIESVSSMLGHKSIRTTQIYAKVVREKISMEMKELKTTLSDAKKKEKEKNEVQ